MIPCSYWALACVAVLPSCVTSYVVSVRQARVLPVVSLFPHPASFRSHLAVDTLAFGCILPTTGRIRDFHPLETCAARRTRIRKARGVAAGLDVYRVQRDDKPGYVVGDHLSRPAVAGRLKQPTCDWTGRPLSRFGLASDGVYMCPARYRAGGSLLHCPSTLTNAEPGGLAYPAVLTFRFASCSYVASPHLV